VKPKRNLIQICLLWAVLLVLPVAVNGQDYVYTTNTDGSLNISQYTGSGGVVTIPSTNSAGLLVTSIGAYAFDETSLSSVTIPNTIANIGDWAFEITSLTNVMIGNGVTNIGNGAFAYCYSLTATTVDPDNSAYSSVAGVLFNKNQTTIIQYPTGSAATSYSIPASVTSIGNFAFNDCYFLTNITIPNGVTSIGNFAFESCIGLTNLTIPNSVTSIGSWAFQGCFGLATVTIGNSLTNIGQQAFYSCGSSLSGIYFQGSAPGPGDDSSVFGGDNNAIAYYLAGTTGWEPTFDSIPTVELFPPVPFLYTTNNGTITITGYTGTDSVVTIPSSINGLPVTTIGDGAFDNNSSMINVTIPDSVSVIGNSAFYGASLYEVTMGVGVSYIGDNAFYACRNLVTINFAGNPPFTGSSIFSSDYNATIYYLTGTSGWDSSFLGVPAVQTSLPFPGPDKFNYVVTNGMISVTSYIGPGGTVMIPDTIQGLPVTDIGDEAFFDNFSISNVIIPNTVTTIEADAFGNTSLGSITIPDSVATIGNSAFYYCVGLTNVIIPSSVTNIGTAAFGDCHGLNSITVVSNNLFYSSLNGVLFNKTQTTLVEYPYGLAGSYSIPDGVSSVGDSAFYACNNLTAITIPDSVTNIGQYALAGSALTSVTIPKNVVYIGPDVFGTCWQLLTIIVDTNNLYYSSLDGILFDKGQATLVDFPGGLNASFTIPLNVLSIGDSAFEYCTLTNITISGNVTNIGISAFHACLSLESVTILGGLATVGNRAFFACENLNSVTIPSSVTNFSNSAFSACYALENIYFTGNAPSPDLSVFEGDNLATAYYLPGTTGWSATFDGVPTVPWYLPYPLILNNRSSFGLHANGFGFTVSWATNTSFSVAACTNLANPVWTTLQTLTLTNGSAYFNDPQLAKYSSRFYRISSP